MGRRDPVTDRDVGHARPDGHDHARAITEWHPLRRLRPAIASGDDHQVAVIQCRGAHLDQHLPRARRLCRAFRETHAGGAGQGTDLPAAVASVLPGRSLSFAGGSGGIAGDCGRCQGQGTGDGIAAGMTHAPGLRRRAVDRLQAEWLLDVVYLHSCRARSSGVEGPDPAAFARLETVGFRGAEIRASTA